MKGYTLLYSIIILLAVSACTQDDLSTPAGGVEGIPMTFSAMGLPPTTGTRAPVDGNWEGVQSVAVLMDGTVKAYNVTPSTADNTSATLTSTDPHYWTNHTDRLVTAWWPYTAGETTQPAVKVAADQSTRKDFEGSDLIVAEEQTVSYGNPTLRFTHRTAQITVVLTNYTEGLASVRLTGLSTENGNPAVIAPYDKGGDTYTALVAPQSVATGTAFITCAFTNGKVFVYKMQKAAEWKAGEEYTYTVSLAAAEDPGYTVSEDGKTYNVTSADGLLAWNEAVQKDMTLNCTLADNIDLTGKDWTPIGDYDNRYTSTFDGGNHTITGLTINQYGNYVGMIDFLDSGGTVQNLTLENVNITGGDIVGSVVGDNYGTVTACYATGSVTGSGSGTIYVGGVTGSNNLGTLTACYHAKRNINGPNGTTGGVVGRNFKDSMIGGGIITACYWGGNGQTQGIGKDEVGTGGTTQVTDGNWSGAKDDMNTALENTVWYYKPYNDGLPVLARTI